MFGCPIHGSSDIIGQPFAFRHPMTEEGEQTDHCGRPSGPSLRLLVPAVFHGLHSDISPSLPFPRHRRRQLACWDSHILPHCHQVSCESSIEFSAFCSTRGLLPAIHAGMVTKFGSRASGPATPASTSHADEPINVLILGETANGKSTLIRRLGTYSGNETPDVLIGNGKIGKPHSRSTIGVLG